MFLKRFDFLLHPSGEIEVSRGVRTLFALAVPLVVGRLLQWPTIGLWVGLCAQMFMLADGGGLYSVRAKTLLGTTLGVALAMVIATGISGLGLTVAIAFVWLFLAGYLTVYGESGAAAGLVIGLAFLFAITLPPGDLWLAAQRGVLVLLGGSWAMILAIVIWPFQPNQPLCQVVARNFQGISNYLTEMSLAPAISREQQTFAQVRLSLLQSRQMLVESRRGGMGRSDLRELLIVLIEDSDRIMTTLTAMQEMLDLHPLVQLTTIEILIDDIFHQVAQITAAIADLILGKNRLPDCDRLQRLIEAVAQQGQLQRQALSSDLDEYTSLVTINRLHTFLQKLQQQLRFATQTARHLHQRNSRTQVRRHPDEVIPQELKSKKWWEPLQENWNFESPLFRHALRLGLGTALGILIYTFAHISQGFWIGLTLVIVLKPDFSVTFQRFFNRIIGTILGIGVVELLLSVLHDPSRLEIVGILSIAIALALVRFHYSLAVFFITIYAIISSELYSHDPTINALLARIICTLIGGAIALGLSYGFGRPKEEELFSDAAAKAIAHINQYFQDVMAVYLGQNPYKLPELNEARNQARLANSKTQASLQRLIDDPNTPLVKMEPAITLTNYIPRLGRAVTVLLTQLEDYDGTSPHPNVTRFTQQVTQSLEQLERSLLEGMMPPTLPPLETTVEEILDHLQTIQKERLSEIANHQHGTPTARYLRDYNIVTRDLQEIVRRIQSIHTALQRFETPA